MSYVLWFASLDWINFKLLKFQYKKLNPYFYPQNSDNLTLFCFSTG
jgi:hypothetical protein